jgi:hypothetical protein
MKHKILAYETFAIESNKNITLLLLRNFLAQQSRKAKVTTW